MESPIKIQHNNLFSNYQNKSLILLLISLVTITILYQTRSFLDDSQFAWISVPSYSIIPALLVVFSIYLTIKLKKKKHFQANAFLLFAIGASMWFIAEQIWATYDHVFNEDPFPSIADVFFLSAYPFYISFLILSLKPIRNNIPKKIWAFVIFLSFLILIPSIVASIDSLKSDEFLAPSIALTYPVLSSIQLIPALIGIMFLTRKKASYTWMLLLFGFIMFSASDTVFLFTELNDAYYDGHPVDLMFLYSFILLIFSMDSRMKIIHSDETSNEVFFAEKIQFETISRYGIPLLVIMISMITTIFIISETYIVHNIPETNDDHEYQSNLMIAIFVILTVFSLIVLVLNTSLRKLVKMRTTELENQKSNLQEAVSKKQEELVKAERLSAMGELSGRLAHDLRNPLSIIKMATELIKQYPAETKISDNLIRHRLELIDKSISRMSHQIDDVLGYVRHSPLQLEKVSLKDTLQKSIEKCNVPPEIQINLPIKDITISCDLIKIDAVFINLITNAIQAMNDNGIIDIKISSEGDYTIIEFIDTGSGIRDDHVDKIFEPLFTTKQTGTGLGLSICKNIIEQHGGQIHVRNNPTTFTLTIPKKIPDAIQ